MESKGKLTQIDPPSPLSDRPVVLRPGPRLCHHQGRSRGSGALALGEGRDGQQQSKWTYQITFDRDGREVRSESSPWWRGPSGIDRRVHVREGVVGSQDFRGPGGQTSR